MTATPRIVTTTCTHQQEALCQRCAQRSDPRKVNLQQTLRVAVETSCCVRCRKRGHAEPGTFHGRDVYQLITADAGR